MAETKHPTPNTRARALQAIEFLLLVHKQMRKHCVLDVIADNHDESIRILSEDRDWFAGMEPKDFDEQVGAMAADVATTDTAARNNMVPQLYLTDDALLGPQLFIDGPQHGAEVQVNGTRVWVNVDGICRLRIGNAPQVQVEVDNKKVRI